MRDWSYSTGGGGLEKKWGWVIIFVYMKRGGSKKAMQQIGGGL